MICAEYRDVLRYPCYISVSIGILRYILMFVDIIIVIHFNILQNDRIIEDSGVNR